LTLDSAAASVPSMEAEWERRAAPHRGQFAGDAPKFLAREIRSTKNRQNDIKMN
jgi:hypothetical protein